MIMSGTSLFYHYFSSIQIAMSSLITGIDIYSMSVPFYALTKSFVMAGAVYYFVSVYNISVKRTIWAYIVILFTTGVEFISVITYYHHIFRLPFGFDIGYAFGLLFFTFMIMQYRMEKVHYGVWFGASLSWAICVGAKAPIAGVFLMFPGILCLNWLFKKKWRCFLYGGAILVEFFLISIFFVGLLGVASGDSNSYYLKIRSLSEVFSISRFIKSGAKFFLAMPTILVSGISMVYLLYRNKNSVAFNKDSNYLMIASLITAIWGTILWLFIEADGRSEMYYLMASFIPLYVVLLIMAEYLPVSIVENIERRRDIIICNVAVVSITIVGMLMFFFISWGKTGAITDSVRYILKPTINSSESLEASALSWIRGNTQQESIIVCDDAIMGNDNKAYAYGIISERQQYLEGVHMLRFGGEKIQGEIKRRTELVQSLFSGKTDSIKEFKAEGVDYIVRTNKLSPEFKENDELIEKVFENDSVEVYRIKN